MPTTYREVLIVGFRSCVLAAATLCLKSETRSSKSETDTKHEIQNQNRCSALPSFGASDFGFVSSFDIRVSKAKRPVTLQFNLGRHEDELILSGGRGGQAQVLGTPAV